MNKESMHMNLDNHHSVKAFLIDLDGVLYVGKKPIAGVKQCLETMDDLGYSYRFVSNSTRRCRGSVAERLRSLGCNVQVNYIFTPSISAIDHMKQYGKERCFLLTMGDVHKDFEDAGISIGVNDIDYVVIGDAGNSFTFERLNQAV